MKCKGCGKVIAPDHVYCSTCARAWLLDYLPTYGRLENLVRKAFIKAVAYVAKHGDFVACRESLSIND